jgi:hypothetical protein
MHSTKLARIYRWTIILGSLLAIISASDKMINSDLATGDMEAYLHAARLMRDGQDIYATPSRPPEMGGLYYIYPPALAVLFIPLTFIPVEAAIVLWCIINVALLGWIIGAFYHAMTGVRLDSLPAEQRWTIIFFSLLPVSRFILHHLFYGQANILILALAVAGVGKIQKTNPLAGGLALGLSVAIKVVTYPLCLWLLLKRNARAMSGVILGTAVGFFLPALVTGFGRNLDNLLFWLRSIAMYDLREAKVPLYVNVSMQAQLHRFFSDGPAFEYSGRQYYLTLFRLSDTSLRLAEQAALLAMFAAIVLYWRRFRHSDELVSNWGGIALSFCLIPVFSPFAQKHYFVLLLPAFIYIAYVWLFLHLDDRLFRWIAAGSFALLFLTNEEFCGEWLGAIFTGSGCIVWGSLLAAAAIVRGSLRLTAGSGVNLPKDLRKT